MPARSPSLSSSRSHSPARSPSHSPARSPSRSPAPVVDSSYLDKVIKDFTKLFTKFQPDDDDSYDYKLEIQNHARECGIQICLLLLGARPAWRFDLVYGEEQKEVLIYIKRKWGDDLAVLGGQDVRGKKMDDWQNEPLVYSKSGVARLHLEPDLEAYKETVLSWKGDGTQTAYNAQRKLLGFTARAPARKTDPRLLVSVEAIFKQGDPISIIAFSCPPADQKEAVIALYSGIVATAEPILGGMLKWLVVKVK